MNFKFKNQEAIVTGGTRGIGQQIAKDLADMGANVLVTGTVEGYDPRYKSIYYKKVDFTDNESIAKFLEYIEKRKYDICINNAGINRKCEFPAYSQKDWAQTFDVNLNSPFRITKAIISNMRDNNYGRIVNISSLWSFMSAPNRVAYCASKHALNGLTLSLAGEFSQFGVLVNSVSPGFVLTDMTKKNLSPEQISRIEDKIPLRRLATTEDISNVVCFLASPANSYVSGQNIVVDGGFSTICV